MATPQLDRPAIVRLLRAAGCVFAEEEADLLLDAGLADAQLAALVERRASGVPLEQLLGWSEFCGLRVAVEPGVFVPRRRTELLASEAVRLARPGSVVVELCCGAAAVGVVLLARVPGIRMVAVDVDPAAVRCAERNLGLRASVYRGDLYGPLPADLRNRVDVIVANAPYVPSDEIATMPPEARDYEPRVALDGGPDGLDIQRRVIAGAGDWLAEHGNLLIETSGRQARATEAAIRDRGFRVRRARDDDLDATVVIGTAGTAAKPSKASNAYQVSAADGEQRQASSPGDDAVEAERAQ
jgi:release factor glutamine methyltransferase